MSKAKQKPLPVITVDEWLSSVSKISIGQPANTITVEQFAKAKGLSINYAGNILRAEVRTGRMEAIEFRTEKHHKLAHAYRPIAPCKKKA